MTNTLGRFGHHPDPAIDFCVEVEEIQSIHTNQRMGLGGPGFDGLGYEDDFSTVDKRIERAMIFRVGGDEGAVAAKQILRQIERDRS